jgi:hypothetical protein
MSSDNDGGPFEGGVEKRTLNVRLSSEIYDSLRVIASSRGLSVAKLAEMVTFDALTARLEEARDEARLIAEQAQQVAERFETLQRRGNLPRSGR